VARIIADHQAADRPTHGLVRLIPPVTALGTAAVFQVIVVADEVGTVLADRYASQTGGNPTLWYGIAVLLGIAVASCVEGSVAYLMDLYDKHLLARDSVLTLRIGMIAYVAASAGMIHWWADQRHLPAIMSWLLAGMSASALFLWSRGSRWRSREQMRRQGQIDPALPRLPLTAKILHPWRFLMTLWLVSWEPVATTDEARARYAEWKANRRNRKHRDPDPERQDPGLPEETSAAPADTSHLPVEPADEPQVPEPADETADTTPAPRPPRSTNGTNQAARSTTTRRPSRQRARRAPAHSRPSDEEALAALREAYPDDLPTLAQIRETVGGGQSRAIRLRNLLTADQTTSGSSPS
jgi:hypothetical protein